MRKLPPWPVLPRLSAEEHDAFCVSLPPAVKVTYLTNELEDERARSAAWEARARAMHAQLQMIETLEITNRVDRTGETFPGSWQQLSTWKSELAKEVIAAIGPLPPLPDLPTAEKGE